tara:strand:+ start:7897 stop:8139 length:243 start_codon:yes stop_codon:yes gene_type:complete
MDLKTKVIVFTIFTVCVILYDLSKTAKLNQPSFIIFNTDTDLVDIDTFDSTQFSPRSDVLPFNSNIFDQDNIQYNYGIGW